MVFQYFIVGGIVLAIIAWQIITYRNNCASIERLEKMFPEKNNNLSILENEDGGLFVSIGTKISDDFKDILSDINAYLSKVKNKTTDYHVIKDLVNRKAQDVDDVIDTMLSSPLYLGLMATIIGAAIGVIFFALNNLDTLINGVETVVSEGISNVKDSKVDVGGIKVLLTDVGIAMIASFIGVYFTKISTSKYKEAKSNMSDKKNHFLTWILTDLMPQMTDDFQGALVKMTQDLNEFNSTFADNTKELRQTLSLVKDNYEGQVEILESIQKLKIAKIAQANIEVYDKLKGCTDEIERLFDHLGKSKEYIASVVDLNNQIGNIEERTRVFEEVGNYFKNEIEFVKDRQGMIRQHISSLDSVLQDTMSNLSESVKQSISELTLVFQKQNQAVQSLIEEQQKSLIESLNQQRSVVNQKIIDFDDPFVVIKDVFGDIRQQTSQGILDITTAFKSQNDAISQMLTEQRKALELELESQRAGVKEKLNEIPNQFKSFSQTSSALDKLNVTLASHQSELSKQNELMGELLSALNKTTNPESSNSHLQDWLLTAVICGTFILLLADLIIRLMS